MSIVAFSVSVLVLFLGCEVRLGFLPYASQVVCFASLGWSPFLPMSLYFELSSLHTLSPFHLFLTLLLLPIVWVGRGFSRSSLVVLVFGVCWANYAFATRWMWDYIEVLSLFLILLEITSSHTRRSWAMWSWLPSLLFFRQGWLGSEHAQLASINAPQSNSPLPSLLIVNQQPLFFLIELGVTITLAHSPISQFSVPLRFAHRPSKLRVIDPHHPILFALFV